MMQVLELLKAAVGKDPRLFSACSDRSYPMGLLQLNAMRLADIFSDDSNFRSYITIHFVSYDHHSLTWFNNFICFQTLLFTIIVL